MGLHSEVLRALLTLLLGITFGLYPRTLRGAGNPGQLCAKQGLCPCTITLISWILLLNVSEKRKVVTIIIGFISVHTEKSEMIENYFNGQIIIQYNSTMLRTGSYSKKKKKSSQQLGCFLPSLVLHCYGNCTTLKWTILTINRLSPEFLYFIP